MQRAYEYAETIVSAFAKSKDEMISFKPWAKKRAYEYTETIISAFVKSKDEMISFKLLDKRKLTET